MDRDSKGPDPHLHSARQPRALAEEIAQSVRARLGKRDPVVEQLIADELSQLVREPHPADAAAQPHGDSLAAADDAVAKLTERIVISANGRNRGGVVAGLTATLSEMGGDIRDISQTMVGDYYSMLIVVDVAQASRHGRRFAELKEKLEATGKRLGTHVVALHDDLLTAMHQV
jgi:ACT domain-containing protein